MTNWPSSRLRPGARNSIRFNSGRPAHGSPEGTSENSPAFQRRERDPKVSSPEGTAESAKLKTKTTGKQGLTGGNRSKNSR
jgi:hypothetical protein